MTANGNSSFANWQELYQRAILETDPAKVLSVAGEAHEAILDRIEETLTRPHSAEHQQLNDALNGLRHLRQEVRNWQNRADKKVG